MDIEVSIRESHGDILLAVDMPNTRIMTPVENAERFLDAYEKGDKYFNRPLNPFLLIDGKLHLFVEEPVTLNPSTTAEVVIPQPDSFISAPYKVCRGYKEDLRYDESL